MIRIRKQFRFEASHQLMDHDDQCARLHGHSWVMWVELAGEDVHVDGPKRNMLIDFADVKSVVKPLVDNLLDHYHLNDTLDSDMPTSEFIAAWAYHEIAPRLPELVAVEVEETCTSMCRYEK